MSWTNNGGGGKGPWQGGPPSPWGAGPRGGAEPSGPPEWRARLGERWRRVLHGGGLGGPGAFILAALAVALYLLSGFYAIGPNQVGLNLVFGKYTGKTAPGLNYNWPYPVGRVIKLNVTDRNALNVGFLTRPDFARSNATTVVDVPEESLMLTGDENIADVKFVVFWQIDPSHPEDFAFNLADQGETVKAVAESAMREIVGRSQIQKILTAERKVIEPAAQQLMQKVLNSYKAGILVLQVQLQSVDPPGQVIASFRDVTAAQQDEAKLQNQGQAYANTVVPRAKGEAAAIVQKAEGFRAQTVAEAQGQAARFDKVYEAYKGAPAITRARLYLETMERVLGRAPKVVVDDPNGKGVIPYLALPAGPGAPRAEKPAVTEGAR